jgi:PAS domain S-box-containing protein
LFRYGGAIVAAGLALLLRFAFDSVLGEEHHPYVTLYLAVAVVAWLAGWRPALVTFILGFLTLLWFVVPPRTSLAIRGAHDLVDILICLLVTVTMVYLILLTQFTLNAKKCAERAREQLREAHERIRLVLESINDAFIALDHEGRLTYVNRAAGELVGQEPAGLLRKSFWEMWPDPDKLPFAAQYHKALTQHEPVQFEAYFPPPLDRTLEVRCYPFASGHSLFLTDVSARKRAEIDAAKVREILARNNLELESRVEERTAKLHETMADLEHFSYALVHDMRAPLRAMQGYAHLLANDPESPSRDRVNEFCRQIIGGAERLDNLIQDSLNYTKILREQLPCGPIDLSSLVQGLIDSYPNLRQHRSNIRIEGHLPRVQGNQALLAQCFSNLLDNAVKFVAPGTVPSVRIKAEENGGMVRVWIEDNGIGIHPNDRVRVFNMFERVSQQYPGTGIGLSIVRKAVERMGGQVGVESEFGKGSRFWVQLQRAA